MLYLNKVLLKLFRIPKRLYYYMLYQSFRERYDISNDFQFNGEKIEMYGEGDIYLSRGSYCGNYCVFQSAKGCSIHVGKNTAIAHNVRIYTKNRSADDIIDPPSGNEASYNEGNVHIGDNCWIGSNVFIKEGVTIGNNVVVGANSVVTKNLSNNGVYAGLPAKLLKSKE